MEIRSNKKKRYAANKVQTCAHGEALLNFKSIALTTHNNYFIAGSIKSLAAVFVQYLGIVNSIIPRLIEKTKPTTLELSIYSIQL